MHTTTPSPSTPTFAAFDGHRLLAAGPLADVAVAVKLRSDASSDGEGALLVFDDRNGRVIDLDLRGRPEDVVRSLPRISTDAVSAADPATPVRPLRPIKRGPGRPKLGVVGREVTLLPRHWQWLNKQPGGASVTLRKLVETARRASGPQDRTRLAREAAYRFMSAMAGDLAGFEEASRALFAGQRSKLMAESESWPADVRTYTLRLAADGLTGEENGGHAWPDRSPQTPGGASSAAPAS
jgi:hypothetical protein